MAKVAKGRAVVKEAVKQMVNKGPKQKKDMSHLAQYQFKKQPKAVE